MEMPFIYDRYVTGKHFVGRKNECYALSNLLGQREHVVMYEPPKTGMQSVIQQTLFDMRRGGKTFSAAVLDMFNIRSIGAFLTSFGSALIRTLYSSPAEYAGVIEKYLAGGSFRFDPERFSAYDEVISLGCAPSDEDIRMMMTLPARIAEEKGEQSIVILDEFQNILEDPEHERLFTVMESLFSDGSLRTGPGVSFILTGSRVNAMKYIFEHKRYFHRMTEHLPLSPVDEREILEHIRRGFLAGGKVFEREQALGICRLLGHNIWYVNHFCAICYSLSLGYINEGIIMDALNSLTSIHKPRFEAMMYGLTDFQTSLLKAVVDGVVRFSATEIIEKYSLNSSANVKRVKEALMKKEIITFNDRQEPVILDPLFEYWVTRFYFGKTV